MEHQFYWNSAPVERVGTRRTARTEYKLHMTKNETYNRYYNAIPDRPLDTQLVVVTCHQHIVRAKVQN